MVKIDKERNAATVETMGVTREAGLDLMEEGSIQIGDYVLLHVGFVMEKIDAEDAMESLKIYNEILEKLDEEDRKNLALGDDDCDNRASRNE